MADPMTERNDAEGGDPWPCEAQLSAVQAELATLREQLGERDQEIAALRAALTPFVGSGYSTDNGQSWRMLLRHDDIERARALLTPPATRSDGETVAGEAE